MPINFRQQPKLPPMIINVKDDADDVVVPRREQPLPLDRRISIRASTNPHQDAGTYARQY